MTSTVPLRLYLIRHGESVANVDWREFARTNDQHIPLTPRGLEQARLTGVFLAAHLKDSGIAPATTRMWVSPYHRTRQTADAIRKAAGEVIADHREDIALVEQQMGLFDGIGHDEWSSVFPREYRSYNRHDEDNGNFFGRVPQGESAFDVSMRVRLLFADFHRHHKEDGISNLFIVAHAVVLRALAMQWLHQPPEWYLREDYSPNAAVRLIEGKADKGYLFVPEVSGSLGAAPAATKEKPHIAEFIDSEKSGSAA